VVAAAPRTAARFYWARGKSVPSVYYGARAAKPAAAGKSKAPAAAVARKPVATTRIVALNSRRR